MMRDSALMRLHGEDLDAVDLQGLDLLVSLRGTGNAGGVWSQVHNELLDQLQPRLVASFNTDELICYSANRPQVTFLGDHFAAFQAPKIELYLMTDGLDKRFWFLTGVEPDLRWDGFARELLGFIDAFNVQLTVSVAAFALPVPHTRPVGVTAHGNRSDLISEFSTWTPQAELQASVTALLEMRLSELNRDVVGYSLHTPHYVADSEYPQVAVAALEYAGAALKLALPTDRLREAGRLVEEQIAEQISKSQEVRQMVDGFEQRFDAHKDTEPRRSLLLDSSHEMPDANQLGSRVEDFLASVAEPQLWIGKETTEKPKGHGPE